VKRLASVASFLQISTVAVLIWQIAERGAGFFT